MAEYRLHCRQREQCISLFPIQNLVSLTSKSSLLHLQAGVNPHFLPISEQVRSLWETDSWRAFFPRGQLICPAARVVLGGVCHPAGIVGLRHTLCIYHCIMVLFIQGCNPPQSIIMHSLLSSQNVITALWGWVMFTGWARAWLSLSGPGCPILCQDFFPSVPSWQVNRGSEK